MVPSHRGRLPGAAWRGDNVDVVVGGGVGGGVGGVGVDHQPPVALFIGAGFYVSGGLEIASQYLTTAG